MVEYDEMDELNSKIQACMLVAIGKRVFPGGVVGYIRDNAIQVLPFGHLTYQEGSQPVTVDTVYDVASVTKSIPTASVILALAEQGLLSLDDPVSMYVPELDIARRETVLIRHLLSFTAVFDLPKPLSSYASQGSELLLRRILTTPLRYPPGQRFLYADIPYILLGMVAERLVPKPLDTIAEDMFFGPLHMLHTTFHPKILVSSQVAPTEIREGRDVVGEAHDEKARVLGASGQVTGHAGLFSTVPDLLQFGQMILHGGSVNEHRYFTHETISLMQTEVVNNPDVGFSLGWTTHATYMDHLLPADTFGKSGFTGTQILISPGSQRCFVLLTNRTYPTRPTTPDAMHAVRRELADIIFT